MSTVVMLFMFGFVLLLYHVASEAMANRKSAKNSTLEKQENETETL